MEYNTILIHEPVMHNRPAAEQLLLFPGLHDDPEAFREGFMKAIDHVRALRSMSVELDESLPIDATADRVVAAMREMFTRKYKPGIKEIDASVLMHRVRKPGQEALVDSARTARCLQDFAAHKGSSGLVVVRRAGLIPMSKVTANTAHGILRNNMNCPDKPAVIFTSVCDGERMPTNRCQSASPVAELKDKARGRLIIGASQVELHIRDSPVKIATEETNNEETSARNTRTPVAGRRLVGFPKDGLI